MLGMSWSKVSLSAFWLAGIFLAQPAGAFGQTATEAGAGSTAQGAATRGVDELLRQLQSQVQELNGQVKRLREQQESAQSESAELRKELDAAKTQLAALSGNPAARFASSGTAPQATIEERVSKLEENQQMAYAEAAEQNQTKVESSSKYRLRLSGIVLLNMYADRGSVNNQDFPELATPLATLSSGNSFGGSLR